MSSYQGQNFVKFPCAATRGYSYIPPLLAVMVIVTLNGEPSPSFPKPESISEVETDPFKSFSSIVVSSIVKLTDTPELIITSYRSASDYIKMHTDLECHWYQW